MKFNKRENRENSSQRSTALLKLTRTKRREKNCSKTLCSSRVSLWPLGFVHPCSEHGYARVHACIICTYAYMYRRRERDTRYESATNHRTVFCVVPLWSLPPSCPSMNQNRHHDLLETSLVFWVQRFPLSISLCEFGRVSNNMCQTIHLSKMGSDKMCKNQFVEKWVRTKI